MAVHFFEEDIEYTLPQKLAVKKWIKATIEAENHRLKELNFIFCSDEYLLNINKEYLDHDTYTDIVTFDHSEGKKDEGRIIGDIFISIDRCRENAAKFHVDEYDEVCRVIIHGTLHLLGYKDKSREQKSLMRAKEDHYLSTRHFNTDKS